MKRLSVNVPPELHKEAKLVAHLENETLSSLVLRLIRRHVEESQAGYLRLQSAQSFNNRHWRSDVAVGQ